MTLLLVVGISEGASDSHEVVQASEILAKIERGEPVEYDGVIIEGDLDLSELDLPTEDLRKTDFEIYFQGHPGWVKLIKSPIIITSSEIRGNVSLGNLIFQAVFQKSVNFEWTNFSGYTNFWNAKFNGDADFECAKFNGNVGSRYAQFNSDANFYSTQFNGDANFEDVQFNGYAHFGIAKFNGYTSFLGAQFSGAAGFGGAQFSGAASFGGAQFSDNADFGWAKFNDTAIFGSAQFSDNADFGWAQFRGGNVRFMYAQFSGDADFYNAQFSGNADFERARFSDKLNSKMDFRESLFYKNTSFVDTQFSQYADFREARFNDSLDLTHARFDRLELRWSSIENHLNCDDAVYMALIKNYENLAWFEDADNCLYNYREWRRKKSKFGITKLLDYAALVSCGYGVKPQRPLILGLFVIMICALYYRWTNAIRRHEKEVGHQEANIWDAFYFSMMTFTTVGYGDWYPLDKHRKLVMIEGILGWLLLSLFLVTLANVIIR